MDESFPSVGLGFGHGLELASFAENDGMMPVIGVTAGTEAEMILQKLESFETGKF
jgi:hypothetical protein